jgi:hypothetical protein
MSAYVTTAATRPSSEPMTTWAVVWSFSTTRDQPVSATSRYAGTSQGPNSSARIVTEPEATAQWMEIFHTVVMAASAATLPSMHPKYPDNSAGAPSPISNANPTATHATMNESTISRGRFAPTFLSAHWPRLTPRLMNAIGSTPANSAATAPQTRPCTPAACQPTASVVAMIQFFGSSR